MLDNSNFWYELLCSYFNIIKFVCYNELFKYNVLYYIEIMGVLVYVKVRLLLFDRYVRVKEEFKVMIEFGICRLLKSVWVSFLYVVLKKNGDIWFCGDYWCFNVIIKFDCYFILFLKDFIYLIVGKKVFVRLDFNRVFYFIFVVFEDIEKIVIIIFFGLFEFLCMIFGLRNVV